MGRGPPAGRCRVRLGGGRTAPEARALLSDVAEKLKEGNVGEIRCDVRGLRADLVAIEMLSRVALAARRRDVSIVFEGVEPELRELIELAGLADALLRTPALPQRPDAPGARTAGRSAASRGRT